MTLTTDKNGTQLTVHLSGELNTMTAPELTALLDKELAGVKALTLDFRNATMFPSQFREFTRANN